MSLSTYTLQQAMAVHCKTHGVFEGLLADFSTPLAWMT